MSETEAAEFLAAPHANEAVILRRYDDAAKIEGLAVPQLSSYLDLVKSVWH